MLGTDYLLSSFIFGTINKISTGFWLYDILCTISLITIIGIVMDEKSRTDTLNYIRTIIMCKSKYNTIVYCSSDKEVSVRYRSLMHLISKSDDPTVKGLAEIEIKRYNRNTDTDEVHTTVYRVSQNKRFKINDNIEGRVFWTTKDKTEYNGKISYTEYQNLEISSNKISLKEMIEWVELIEKDYKEYLKAKMIDTHTLVEVRWNSKEECIDAFYTPWKSNVTFENRFFTGKKEIIDKINFFLKNEQWYKDRGIPYTLGILLWGQPGCGKTGFIKALMNLTERHGIDIKLSKKFNMNSLKQVICDDEITEDLIIPQNKRILLFEDIDAMGEVVKDRDLPKDGSDIDLDKKISEAIRKSVRSKKLDDSESDGLGTVENDNNNLSYFLNILDGLNECPGRIIIMTTNKPEYLDKALIRPGRIDFKINMTKATIDDIKEILEFYWNSELNVDIIETTSEKLSHAEIVSCCRLSDNIENSIKKIYEIIDSQKQETDKSSIKSDTSIEF
jgi:ATP-dependent 26S proteasome regulatory subunit